MYALAMYLLDGNCCNALAGMTAMAIGKCAYSLAGNGPRELEKRENRHGYGGIGASTTTHRQECFELNESEGYCFSSFFFVWLYSMDTLKKNVIVTEQLLYR